MTYNPELVPHDTQDLGQFLQRELERISIDLGAVEGVQLPELNVAPDKPRTGMIVLADGTNWDPGSGAGFYGYRGGSWVLLG